MSKTILIVDDSIVALDLMQRCLQSKGFKSIILAHTGEEGMELAKSKNIDLVVLDVNLPDGNGFDFCKRIKSEIREDLKVINITGDVDNLTVDNQEKIKDVGADDFVVKTSAYERLLTSVKKLI